MFYNGAKCDIYIGKGAGKKLLQDIRSAKKSIKIVSPYLSPFLLSELITFSNRNLEVQLITTDDIEDFYGNYQRNIYKLINQHRYVDEGAVQLREKWKDTLQILRYCTYGLITMLIGATYFYRDVKVIFGLIPLFVLFFTIGLYKTKIKEKRIYSYWYSKLFPFKVYMSPDRTNLSDTFIHGKIYLIDDEIVYLGSLNFTSAGTESNYETRIRTTDPNLVNAVMEEFNHLMNHSNLPEKDIQFWGKRLYMEPIN